VQVYDARGWQHVAELRGSTAEVSYATFSRDARRLAVASADGVVRLYQREQFAPRAEVLELVATRVMRQPAELTAEERAKYVPR
jgi:hypothetical protein